MRETGGKCESPCKILKVQSFYNMIYPQKIFALEERNDGSSLRLVCECTRLLGRHFWHYIERNQRLGLRDHLADIDDHSDWHYRCATQKDSPALQGSMNHVIEIRSINLKPGKRDVFHRLYIEEALPRLKHWNFDVVAHGPSLHDENSYCVIRRFDILPQRE
jgi:hypothetical protein